MAVTPRTEPWSALLEAGRSDDRLVREAYEGARAPVFGELPADLHPTVGAGPGQRGDRRALHPPGAGAARRVGGDDDRHHRDGERQVAVLQPADARGPVHRRQGAGALPLPDQGARPGPGARAQRLRAAQAGAPGDLRRRHQARGAPGHPPAVEPRAHQPRHAPRRDPAQPRGVGRLLRQPRRRRGRRGARLPRRVRRPRRQRPAPAAARRRAPTARRRASCSPARRSPTPSSWPSASPAWRTCGSSTRTARRAPGARSRCGTRP